MRRSTRTLILICGGLLAAAVCVRLFPLWKEYDLSRHDLASLLQMQSTHQNDDLFLQHLAKRLNAAQRFAEALPLWERAVGISPGDPTCRDEWAKAQMGTGQVAQAYGQLKEFASKYPEAAEPPFLLGKFYITQAAFGPARGMLETAVKRNPKNGEAWSLLAHCRIKMGDHGGAEEALKKAVALRSTVAEDYLQLGTLLSTRSPDQAEPNFQQALRLSPKNAIIHREYSRFLFSQNRIPDALREAQSAVTQNSADPSAQLLLGRCLLAANKPGEAIPAFLTAAAQFPNDPNPAEGLRRAYRQTGERDNAALWDKRFMTLRTTAEAKRKAEQATLAHPGDRAAHERYATYLCADRDVNGCARQFALSLKTTPDNPRVLIATASALNRVGFAEEALPLARQAHQQAKNNPASFAVLGDILVNLGRLHEAAVNYEQVSDWNADQVADYQRKIAEAKERLAQSKLPTEVAYRQAMQAMDMAQRERLLKSALDADPGNTRALRELLQLQFGQARTEEATEMAKRLMDLAPEDGLSHCLYCILFLKENKDRALTEAETTAIRQHLQMAKIDSSVSGTIYYVRGLLAMQERKPAEAIASLEQARQLDPAAMAVYPLLAEAYKAQGNTSQAEKTLAEFRRLTAQ